MTAPLLWKHFVELQSAPLTAITVAAVGSFAGQVAAVAQAAPLWVYIVAAVAPWLPIFVLELIWTYRHHRWLAIFCLLIVSQAAYLIEHVAQMTQVHALGRTIDQAPGIFGALDFERVQFLWTTWAALGVLLLLNRFPRNPYLWVLLAFAGLDAAEHTVILATYLTTGVIGSPGLIAQGGVLGTIGMSRPDLQFLYAVGEMTTLCLAFAYQLSRTYDAWLARAFPHLPENVLIETTGRLEEVLLRPGERMIPDNRRWYIITRGNGTLTREGPGGHDILLSVLSPGQVIRDGGILHAETTLEVLAVPSGVL